MPHLHSLEPQERNVRQDLDGLACGSEALQTPIDVVFRHSGWQPDRTRIREALDRSGVPQTRLDHWDGCGADAWVLRDPENPERLRIASSTCKDRFCVPCADTRSARIGRRIRDKIATSAISFLTLTLADNDQDLSGLIDKLLRSFRSLRQWDRWRTAVAGGVAFIEVKWNAEKKRWHPHLHAIMSADYLPQAAIAERWRAITKTSYIVWITRPPNTETVIRYVTKYGSKPLDHAFVSDPDRLDEAIAALKGRHLAAVFGDWRGWALLDDDEHETWETVDSLSNLLRRAERGDPAALKIMERLRCTTPMATTATTDSRAPPDPPPAERRFTRNYQLSASYAASILPSSRISLGTERCFVPSASPDVKISAPITLTFSQAGIGSTSLYKPLAFRG